MSNLLLDCDKDFSNIANAVYKVTKQKINLSAEVVFVDKDEIQRLNRENRNIDKVTDVLSFPTLDNIRGNILRRKDYPFDIENNRLFIGSVVINEDKVKEQAVEYGHSEERERTYLIVHSLMHLMGYDHMVDEDKKEMRDMEKKALSLLGIE